MRKIFLCLLILFTSSIAYGYALPSSNASPEEIYKYEHHCELLQKGMKQNNQNNFYHFDSIILITFPLAIIILTIMLLRDKIGRKKYIRYMLLLMTILILIVVMLSIGGKLNSTICIM